MKRLPVVSYFLASMIGGLFTANQTTAQVLNNPYRTYGVGIGVYNGPRYGPYPYYGGYGPYVGGFILDYQGFYGNGMSKYGPPVPTYGVVPGTFGGSDYRVNQNAPFFGMGLGWFGYRSPSPRPPANFNFNPPAFGPDGQPVPLDAEIIGETGQLIVEVRLPIENAIVFVNDEVTKTTGPVRMFGSPPLKPGETYEYTVRAEWIIDGQKTSLTQKVQGKPGERVVADFQK
jgi:uncharacterized protein (TIGR03000 family)